MVEYQAISNIAVGHFISSFELFKSTTTQIIQNDYHTSQGVKSLPLLHKSIKNLAEYGIPILGSSSQIDNEANNRQIKPRGLPVFQ